MTTKDIYREQKTVMDTRRRQMQETLEGLRLREKPSETVRKIRRRQMQETLEGLRRFARTK